VESVGEDDNSLISFFGYKSDGPEPRLFALPYSRSLHEKIEKEIKPKLQRGQPVAGRLTKAKKAGYESEGKLKPSNKKGDGSESQEQEWQFHELLPSEIHNKPER